MRKNRIAIIGLTGQSIFMTVDQFHKDGETKKANTLQIEPGGKGYNQAIENVDNQSLKALLKRIIEDEKLHIKILTHLRDNVKFMSY